MKVQAEVSLYLVRQNDLTEPIQQFVESVKCSNLNVKTGAMSSLISGDSQVIFQSAESV